MVRTKISLTVPRENEHEEGLDYKEGINNSSIHFGYAKFM
jgi:hypothetical protein